MTTLKERYIAAVLEHVPEGQRTDVAREIRAAIDEMIESRFEAGEPEDAATEQALNELGDPSTLARSYQDRPGYLIGPGWYPSYLTVLKTVLVVALPFVALAQLVAGIGIDGETVSDAIQETVGSLFLAAVQIAFWVTVTFALLDRFVEPDAMMERNDSWTVAELPEKPAARQVTLGGVLTDVIAMIIVAVLLAVQTRGIAGFGRISGQEPGPADHMPLLNPDIGGWWMAALFGLVVLSIVSPIIRYVRGYWTRPVMMLEMADSALWIVYVLGLAATAPIVNPAFAERVDAGATWWKTGGTANIVIAIVVIWISAQTAWEAWQGYREYVRVYEGAGVRQGGASGIARTMS